MGKTTFSRETFTRAAHTATDGGRESATKRSEQQAKKTGKLDPLVDPAGYGLIRRSLPRFEEVERRRKQFFELTVGPPLNIETCVDTTGSMGDNVDIAMSVLPHMYEGCLQAVESKYDLQIATGIFGDVKDQFPLCRPQFEMEADKIVKQLSLMVPEKDGGDEEEDPHYGLFAAAYLTDAYIVKIGLKGYYFTVTDAPARDELDERQLLRIFGAEVFDKVKENGHQISKSSLPSTKDVVKDLLKRSHAFLIQVGEKGMAPGFWKRTFPKDRIVQIPDTRLLPQVEAAIIGLTEGTLDLGGTKDFLRGLQVPARQAEAIVSSLANIPLGAQAALPNYGKLPKKGDLFESKTSLWPVDSEGAEAPEGKKGKDKPKKDDWL